LKEFNANGKFELTWKFKAFDNDGAINFGAGHTYKKRDFDIKTFMVNVRNIQLTGNPDELFAAENLWPYNNQISKGTTVEATFLPNNPNEYQSTANNTFAFASTTLSPAKFMKAVVGVRSELYTQRYTGRDQLGYNVLDNQRVLNKLGIFPSLNLTFALNKKQNIRLAYGKTTARPSFKEMSYAEIVDPLTGRTFIGGMFKDEDKGTGTVYWDGNLRSTDIHNVDLRWEFFPTPHQTISVSAFYKKFYNPIEIVQFASQAGSFQPRNVGDGQVIGAELEFRLSLGFIAEKLSRFSVSSNFTYSDSRIQFSETEKISRLNNAREGEKIHSYRKMAGQAPYVINAGLMYNGGEKKFLKQLEIGLFYQVQGPTLMYVGMVDRPDVYSVPFHSLNFNASKKFGKKEQWSVGLKVSNLLNDKKEEIYKSFQANKAYFSRLTIGTMSSIKIGFQF
jgi:outer membrane receptor protein involved in Fe transport